MKLTSRDVVEILKAIKELGYRRFRLQRGDFVLEVSVEGDSSGVASSGAGDDPGLAAATDLSPALPQTTPAGGPIPDEAGLRPPKDGALAIRAPLAGTFYRALAPETPPFVEEGDRVGPNDTVCIIEIMKLFNSIRAGVSGKVLQICVANEATVSAGQTLMWVDPA